MSDLSTLFYDTVSSDECVDAFKIEQQVYPSDEAATYDSLHQRITKANDLFLGAYLPSQTRRKLIGYVCATLSPSDSLTHESMTSHVPESSSVCIHSVCVALSYQHKGIGLRLMQEYVKRLKDACRAGSPYKRVMLISHEHLCQFYEKAGFKWIGKSEVVHGSQPWFLMRQDLDNSSPSITAVAEDLPAAQAGELTQTQTQIPPGVWDALQRSSTRSRPAARPLTAFSNKLADVLELDKNNGGTSTNKFNLLCPRPGCGSVILNKGVAQWVEGASVSMDPTHLPNNDLLPTLPDPPETTHWWLITPSPMAFENIGFSRTVDPQLTSGLRMKLLACAECDLGPLGWCQEGGSEFWLACARVGYQC